MGIELSKDEGKVKVSSVSCAQRQEQRVSTDQHSNAYQHEETLWACWKAKYNALIHLQASDTHTRVDCAKALKTLLLKIRVVSRIAIVNQLLCQRTKYLQWSFMTWPPPQHIPKYDLRFV